MMYVCSKCDPTDPCVFFFIEDPKVLQPHKCPIANDGCEWEMAKDLTPEARSRVLKVLYG